MATNPTTAPTEASELDGQNRPEKRHISTFIRYYRDAGDGSPPITVEIKDGMIHDRRPFISKPVIVKDITGEEDKYRLDTHGFQFCRHTSQMRGAEFQDDELVKEKYYPEAVQLLKDITNASRVVIFDHAARVGLSNRKQPDDGNDDLRSPVFRVHIDQSYAGAEMVLRQLFPDEADELLKRRYQTINIWRPIKTIRKDPLAVIDARSVPDSDLLEASILLPQGVRTGSWTVLPNDAHRWYFKDAQEPDEVLLFKCFDSATTPGLARRTPHSAFQDPAMADCEPRQSIDVRALVVYDDYTVE